MSQVRTQHGELETSPVLDGTSITRRPGNRRRSLLAPASWEKLDISPRQKVRNRTDELTVDDVLEAREDPRPVAQLKQLTGIEVLS